MGELTETCARCRSQKPLAELRKTPKGLLLCNTCVEKITAPRTNRQKTEDAEYEAMGYEAIRKVAWVIDVLCFCIAPAYLFWLIIDHIAFFRAYSTEAALCLVGILFGVVTLFWRKSKKPVSSQTDLPKTKTS